ncbi:MAG: DUF4129 domain-containing protein [Bacteroidota bacterium]
MALLAVALLGTPLLDATATAQTKPTEPVPSERDEKVERAARMAELEAPPVSTLPRDTVPRRAHALPDAALDDLRADPAYAYDRVVVQQPSLWDQFMAWLSERLFRPASEAIPPDVQRWIIYLLAGAALAFALLKLLGADFGGVFRRRETAVATVQALDDLTAIDEVDLVALLADAERTGAGPLAVRLHYLLYLQALAARDLIDWAPATTNRAYALALEGSPRADLVPAFRDLTRLFEAAWYGDFEVDAELYAEVRRRFGAAMQALDGPTTPATASAEVAR